MKKILASLLLAGALFLTTSQTSRADEFSQIEHSPYTYWVPPPPGYAQGGPYYGPYGPYGPYYGPGPYYGGPPVRVYVGGPPVHFFFGFHFH